MNGPAAFYGRTRRPPFWRFTNPIILFVGTLTVVIGFGLLASISPAISAGMEMLFKILIYAVIAAAFIFPLIGLVDCLSSEFDTNTKLLWIIIILVAPFLGASLWFLWGKHLDKSARTASDA